MKMTIAEAIKIVVPFVSREQMTAMKMDDPNGGGKVFVEGFLKIAAVIGAMPTIDEDESDGPQTVAHLHYFSGSSDWFIFEKHIDAGAQAYGYAIPCGDLWRTELGRINIEDLTSHGVQLDLNFTPKTFMQIQRERGVFL